MTPTTRIDVPRLIRIATFLVSVAATAAVYLTYQPQIEAVQQRIDENNDELRSDDVAFHEANLLRGERATLSARYASLFAQDAQAVFVRELATTVRRHGVELVATNVAPDDPSDARGASALFSKTQLALELRGSYRRLLTTIADLSLGSEIVEVRASSLSREGTELVAKVPLAIYEPLRATSTVAPSGREGSR